MIILYIVLELMDLFEKRLQEEIDFWQTQIELAEKRHDESVLPRLRDALKLVEFKMQRYLGPEQQRSLKAKDGRLN